MDAIDSVEIYDECSNKKCSKRIIQASSKSIIHCDQCGRCMRVSVCKKKVCVKVVVMHHESFEDVTLTLFNNMIEVVLGEGCAIKLDNTGIAD